MKNTGDTETLTHEQDVLLRRLSNKAERMKVEKLALVVDGLNHLSTSSVKTPEMYFALNFFGAADKTIMPEFFYSNGTNSMFADNIVDVVTAIYRRKMFEDAEISARVHWGTSPLKGATDDGSTVERVDVSVSDSVIHEKYVVSHKTRKHRYIIVQVVEGGLEDKEKLAAVECVYALLKGSVSGEQVLDLRNTVKVAEIVANNDVSPKIKALALYSTFDHTLYNIDWSSDPRLMDIPEISDFSRKDKILSYERHMKNIFSGEINEAL